MRTKIILFCSILCSTVFAQHAAKMPSIEEMNDRKWQEISTQAKLTEDEKKAVYPVFLEYENALWRLNKDTWDCGKKVKQCRKQGDVANCVNYSEINDKCINNEIKQAAFLKEYHEKLRKLLSAEKLFNYYQAERMFKKKLMQHAGEQHKDKK
ncbi:MAG: hypothetical protein LBV31_01795 [Prevotellaceae bacterium]|jgi:hypothetical protein|nr:hypothetical protein [Prevotellaceae bacterium]